MVRNNGFQKQKAILENPKVEGKSFIFKVKRLKPPEVVLYGYQTLGTHIMNPSTKFLIGATELVIVEILLYNLLPLITKVI